MEYKVKILKVNFVTKNVKSFLVERPENYKFNSGQATMISINKPGLEKEKRPITFASTNEDLILEFIIKKYSGGITEKMHKLKPGDEFLIEDAFGSITYKGEGIFIAGGTGITPFISILRELNSGEENKLIFSNKTFEEIISEKELKNLIEDILFVLTNEKKQGYFYGRINQNFLKENIKDFNQFFYICGPGEFVNTIKKDLLDFGVKQEKIIVEGG